MVFLVPRTRACRQTYPNKQTDKPSNLQTIEQRIGQNNDFVPHVKTAPKRNTNVGDAENHQKGEESVSQASSVEKN